MIGVAERRFGPGAIAAIEMRVSNAGAFAATLVAARPVQHSSYGR